MKKDTKIKTYDNETKSFIDTNFIVDGTCQVHLYTILFESLTYMLDEEFPIKSSWISETINGKIPLNSEILKAAQNAKFEDVCGYFNWNLIPNIPENSRSVVVDAIEKLVENDQSLGKSKITALKGKKKRNEYAYFLAEVWVLAVCQSYEKNVTKEEQAEPNLENEPQIKVEITENPSIQYVQNVIQNGDGNVNIGFQLNVGNYNKGDL